MKKAYVVENAPYFDGGKPCSGFVGHSEDGVALTWDKDESVVISRLQDMGFDVWVKDWIRVPPRNTEI